MKHKLFLCILILVVVGLYCQNCIEFFTDDEKNEIQTMLTNQIKSINVGDNQNKLDEIEERLEKKLIDSGKCVGPMGPKGDTGGQTNVYQGLYTKDTNSDILKVNAEPTKLNDIISGDCLLLLTIVKNFCGSHGSAKLKLLKNDIFRSKNTKVVATNILVVAMKVSEVAEKTPAAAVDLRSQW